MSNTSSRKAFTLTELLVAIALIAAVAMLVFPAFRSVQLASHQAKCAANLKQIGAVSLQYFTEHGGQLFPSFWWYNTNDAYPTLQGLGEQFGLSPLTANGGTATYIDTLITCPGVKAKYPDLYPSQWNRGYSLNYFAHAFRPEQQQGGMPLEEIEGQFPGNLRRVRSLSSMWMFMCGPLVSGEGGWVFSYANVHHGPYLSAPHGGRQNAVFFDGHVEAVDREMFAQPESSDFWGGPEL